MRGGLVLVDQLLCAIIPAGALLRHLNDRIPVFMRKLCAKFGKEFDGHGVVSSVEPPV
ncbi:hypothetical protein JSE7799_02775 [Jannaschia seosinensis]|uniref:Uncharacterized protein n=1 Tax=Jannaschia seosinensis TaxID=313367 RepID=A0A0M7BFF4_9RHOB|nr:hypothetical protein [Jannaschia seosinensis]CUH40046.1 hypothetical protein JSE7799_02775 [Jannaschia seosinensis]